MAFCTSCGKQIADSAKFCPFCGTAVQALQTPAAPPAEVPAVPEVPVAPPAVPVQEVPQAPAAQEIPQEVPQAPAAQEIPQAPQYAAPQAPQYAAPAAPQVQYAAPQAPQYGAPAAPQAPQYAPQAPQGYYAPQAQAPGGYYAPQYPPVGTVPAKKSNPLKIIIPIVAVLAVAAVVLILVLGGGSYKKAVDRVFDVYSGDLSGMEDMMPASVWEAVAEDNGYDSAKEYIDELKDQYEEYIGNGGSDVTYSYSIEEDKELTAAELRELKENLCGKYDSISKDSITEARWLKMTVTTKDEDGTDENDGCLGVVKIDGEWYVLSARDDGTVRASFMF